MRPFTRLALLAAVLALVAVPSVGVEFCDKYVHDYTTEERLALSPSFVYAHGALEWVTRVGSRDNDVGWGVAFSNTTAFYVGYFSGRATFGNPQTQNVVAMQTNGLFDAYIMATTHDDGTVKWLVQAGGPFDDNAQGVAVTPDQTGIIVVGYFAEEARFTGPNGASEGLVVNLVASGSGTNVEAFIARYNHDDGALEWAYPAGGNLNDVAWGVTMAPASAIVVGYFQSERFTMRYPVNGTRRPANSSAYTPLRNIAFNESTYEELDNLGDLSLDIFIAAIDYQDGRVRWVKRAGGYRSDIVFDAAVLSSGDKVVMAGYFDDTAYFGGNSSSTGTRLKSAGRLDGYLATYNLADGKLVAVVAVGGPHDDVILAVEPGPSDRIIASGWFTSSSVTLGNWTVVNRGSLDAMVVYMEAPGTGFNAEAANSTSIADRAVMWLISPAWGPSQQSISALSINARQDRVLVGGFHRGQTTFLHDNGTVVENTLGDGSTDMTIGSIALSDGTFKWRISPGGPLNDQIVALAASPVRVFFTGFQRSTVVYGGKLEWEGATTIVAIGGIDSITGSLGDIVPPLVHIETNTILTNTTLAVNVTFSEFALDLELEDVEVSSGRAADIVIRVEGTESSFNVVDMEDGLVTVGLRPGAVFDPTGNVNVIPPEPFSITFDGTAPTASLYSPLWDPTSADFIPITVTFSECVTDFTLDDVNLSSGTTCGLRALTPCRRLEPYVLDFEVWGMVSGNFTANISAWAVMDLAGNGNVVVPEYGITVDKTQPQVELSSDTPSPTNQNITVTVTFDVRVAGFELEDVEISSGTKYDLIQLSPRRFKFHIHRPAQGTVFVNVPPGVAFDDADNPNARAPEFTTAEFDSVPPTVRMTTDSPTVTNRNVDVTVTYSEQVVGFTVDDLSLSSGTWSEVTAVNNTVFYLTVLDARDGELIMGVGPQSAVDLAGNVVSNTAVLRGIFMDRTRPVTNITSPNPRPTNDTIILYISFSEWIDEHQFDLAHVIVSSGDVSKLELVNKTRQGTTWSCQVKNMLQGPLTVDVGEVLTDPALNVNLPAPQLVIVYDTVPPVPVIWSDTPSPTLHNVIMEVEFSEFVIGFDLGDINMLSGTPAMLEELVPGLRYRFQVPDARDGTTDALVQEKSSSDPAGNGNAASNQFVGVVTDRTNPTVSLHTTMTGPSRTDLVVTAVFNEIVSGFTADDIVLSSGYASDVTPVPAPVVCPPEYEWEFPSAFSFVLREVEDGFPTAWVPASVAMDVAGNMNDAAVVAWSGVEFDTTSPNATLTTSLAGKTFGDTQLTVTITFSELITGFGLDDVILSSGWASNILDVTPDEFRPAWNLLFDSCTTADNANEVARRIGVAYPLPVNDTGGYIASHTLGFSRFTFIVNDADNDRVTVDVRAGAAEDAAGNPTLPPERYTVYKWAGWFTTIGVWQAALAVGAHVGVLILLLAYWQARYMRLRFLGRVSLESTLEEHEEEAAKEAKEKLRLEKLAKEKKKDRKRQRKARKNRRKARKKRMIEQSGMAELGGFGSAYRVGKGRGKGGGGSSSDDSDSSDDEEYRRKKQERRRKSARESVQRILAATTFTCTQCGCHNTVPPEDVHVPSDLEFTDSSGGDSDVEGAQLRHELDAETKERYDAPIPGTGPGSKRQMVRTLTAAELHAKHAEGANPIGILNRQRAQERARRRAREAARLGDWRVRKAADEAAAEAERKRAAAREGVVAALIKARSAAQLGGGVALLRPEAAGSSSPGQQAGAQSQSRGPVAAASWTAGVGAGGTGVAPPGQGAAGGGGPGDDAQAPGTSIQVAVPRRLQPMVRTVSGWKGKRPSARNVFNRDIVGLVPGSSIASVDKPKPEPAPEPEPEPEPEPTATEVAAEARARTRARMAEMRRGRGRPRRPGSRRAPPGAARGSGSGASGVAGGSAGGAPAAGASEQAVAAGDATGSTRTRTAAQVPGHDANGGTAAIVSVDTGAAVDAVDEAPSSPLL